jgi:hypothetical protein
VILIGAGVFLLGVAVYFILLVSDGDKLRKRVWERRIQRGEQAQEVQDGIIKLDYSI